MHEPQVLPQAHSEQSYITEGVPILKASEKRIPAAVPDMDRTNAQYYNMFFAFAQCNGNAAAAARMYREQHPGDRPPGPHAFRRLALRLYSSGSFQPDRRDVGRPPRLSTARVEEVLDTVHRGGVISIRKISRCTGISKSSIHRILQDENIHPYNCAAVQELQSADLQRRVDYARWLLREIARNPAFCEYILWGEEAVFTEEGCFGCHNSPLTDDESPRAIQANDLPQPWAVHLWAGVCGRSVIGPYLLPGKMDGRAYETFLKQVLPGLLEDVPLDVRKNMFFQHDGAPAHYTADVRAHLYETFRGRWIGRGGCVARPPRSPDMNPLGFFFWKYLKNEVYKTPVLSADELIARVHGAIAKLNPAMLANVMRNIKTRAEACVAADGRNFEHRMAAMS